ncbi:MAG: hypothetical protein LCH70_08910 [Proteobacteria bacterium]|nr:hypothetical protein [Pseudomonadota bacterium]
MSNEEPGGNVGLHVTPLNEGLELIFRFSEPQFRMLQAGESSEPCISAVVVTKDVEKPPPKKKIGMLSLSIPIRSGDVASVCKLDMEIDLDIASSGS